MQIFDKGGKLLDHTYTRVGRQAANWLHYQLLVTRRNVIASNTVKYAYQYFVCLALCNRYAAPNDVSGPDFRRVSGRE